MKGYTIQNSINLLEKNGTGGGGSTSAANVTFDNTGTGLAASNVQSALTEILTKIFVWPSDNNEHLINDNVYIRRFTGETLTGDDVLIEAFDGDLLFSFGYVSGAVYKFPVNLALDTDNRSDIYVNVSSGNINIEAGASLRSAYEVYLIYRKNNTNRTRKKK